MRAIKRISEARKVRATKLSAAKVRAMHGVFGGMRMRAKRRTTTRKGGCLEAARTYINKGRSRNYGLEVRRIYVVTVD